MKKSTYILSNNRFIKVTKFRLIKFRIKNFLNRFRLIDKWKYKVVPYSDLKYYFKLSEKEYEEAHKIYKEKGTISYEFYPCGGIGWGVKVHVVNTDEVIDISDVSTW